MRQGFASPYYSSCLRRLGRYRIVSTGYLAIGREKESSQKEISQFTASFFQLYNLDWTGTRFYSTHLYQSQQNGARTQGWKKYKMYGNSSGRIRVRKQNYTLEVRALLAWEEYSPAAMRESVDKGTGAYYRNKGCFVSHSPLAEARLMRVQRPGNELHTFPR